MATSGTESELGALLFGSAVEIASAVAAGTFSAREVLEAHIRQIEAVNPQINAIVVPLFDSARRDADACDRAALAGRPLGPLHGVPVTVKECYFVAGTPSCIGLATLSKELCTVDSPLVARLRAAGAVVVGKTNVPQLMVLYESDNPVYGRTNNPWSLDRSPGGSSGGEAAAVSAGCSALGLGSDLGGSLRHPAHSCGIHGFKPSAARLPMELCRNPFPGMESIDLQPGFVARSVDDLALGMNVLTSPAAGESAAFEPIPPSEVSRLGVGYWVDDGCFAPSPAVARAVEEAADALRGLGARVRRWQPPDATRALHLYWQLATADGGGAFKRLLSGGPIDKRVRRMLTLVGLPRWARRPIAWPLELAGQTRLAELIRFTGPMTADRYWQLTAERDEYTAMFLGAMKAEGIDVLLSPVHALPALRHGKSMYLQAAASYCVILNLMGLPAGSVATTRVQPGEESSRPASRDIVERAAQKVERGSAGMPIGVQVCAPLGEDRTVLGVMAALEKHFRPSPNYPARPPV